MLLPTSYWPGGPAGGFRDHGLYFLETFAAVEHDAVATGLRQVTAQSSGLIHVQYRQSVCSDKHRQRRGVCSLTGTITLLL